MEVQWASFSMWGPREDWAKNELFGDFGLSVAQGSCAHLACTKTPALPLLAQIGRGWFCGSLSTCPPPTVTCPPQGQNRCCLEMAWVQFSLGVHAKSWALRDLLHLP